VAERKPDLARRLGSVLRGAQDRSLGLRALREGLISDQELSGPVGVEDLLRGKGVAPEKIKELHAEIDRDDYALFRPDRAMPLEVSAVLSEPDRRLTPYDPTWVERAGRSELRCRTSVRHHEQSAALRQARNARVESAHARARPAN